MENQNQEPEIATHPQFIWKGKNFSFVRFDPPENIVAWMNTVKAGVHNEKLGIIKIDHITTDSLKSLGVWDKIEKEKQDSLLKIEEEPANNRKENLKKARESRQSKYQNVPSEVICIQCGKEQKMPPCLIVKNTEKWAKKNGLIPNTDKWIEQWKCQKCCPTKGRQPNHNLPPKIELKCKCGKTVVYPASVVLKFAAKKELTVEKYIEGYQCQKCCPTKGRHKRT